MSVTTNRKLIDYFVNRRWKRVILVFIGLVIIIFHVIGIRYMQVNDMVNVRALDYYYCVFSRLVFSVAVFLILLPSLSGKGRLIRWMIGNKIAVVLGRLSFCIYLVH